VRKGLSGGGGQNALIIKKNNGKRRFPWGNTSKRPPVFKGENRETKGFKQGIHDER